MIRRRRVRLTGVAAEAAGTKPYPIRVMCAIEGGGTLIVWGHKDERRNVETIRQARFPCTVVCQTTPPPQVAHVPEAVAWVHPNHDFRIVSEGGQDAEDPASLERRLPHRRNEEWSGPQNLDVLRPRS